MLSLLDPNNSKVTNILPTNKEKNRLILESDFNNEVIRGLQSGLELFDSKTDLSLLRNVNTNILRNTDYDSINKTLKPINDAGLSIGVNRISKDVNEAVDIIKDKLTQPIYIVGLILLILLLKK